MAPAFRPLGLQHFQAGGPLDPVLLSAARQHVGAAGVEQVAALERLVAAGQAYTSVCLAARRVLSLLEQTEDSPPLQALLDQSRQSLALLTDLEQVVNRALEQITSTPVQHISAEVLATVSRQMDGHIAALERLIAGAERSPAVPDSSTPDLEAILGELRSNLDQIAQEQRQGHLTTLVELAVQSAAGIGNYSGATLAERHAALGLILTELTRQRRRLDPDG